MKYVKLFIVISLIFAFAFGSVACGQKVNLQTEDAAIAHLENYVAEKDEWSDIADELRLYYTIKGSGKFKSSSFANLTGDTWLVVLHGSITGYTDYNQTNKGTFEFSYVAEVKTDGTVKKLFIQSGKVTDIYSE